MPAMTVHVMKCAAEAAMARLAIRIAIDAGDGFEPGAAGTFALRKAHRDSAGRRYAH
jgi:hypothetical protein